MKRLVLLFAGLLIGLTTASAQNHQKYNKHHFEEPITFTERNIEFLIFPDGSFDYNTNNRYRIHNSRRSNISYRGPNASITYSTLNTNRNIYVSRNRDASIKRIGNVLINYNRYGQITRAGSVYINYNRGRNGNLNQVGGLSVKYNRWGEIVTLNGQVNRFNKYYNTSYLNNNSNNWDNRRDYDNFDDNYYYYKQNGKLKKQKKNKR